MDTTFLALLMVWLVQAKLILCWGKLKQSLLRCLSQINLSSWKAMDYAIWQYKIFSTKCFRDKMTGHTTSASVFLKYTTSRLETCSLIWKMWRKQESIKEMNLIYNNIFPHCFQKTWGVILGIFKQISMHLIITVKRDQMSTQISKSWRTLWRAFKFKTCWRFQYLKHPSWWIWSHLGVKGDLLQVLEQIKLVLDLMQYLYSILKDKASINQKVTKREQNSQDLNYK